MTHTASWPTATAGVLETVTATGQPGGCWNHAALGIQGIEGRDEERAPVRARTWGNTRTRRNLEAGGDAYVQFLRDPVLFVEAALGIVEREEPVLDAADAWVHVRPERVGTGREGETSWVDWQLSPVESCVRRREVPRTARGYAAIVEMSVAASRLSVSSYDRDELDARLAYFDDVVERCGTPEDLTARDRIEALTAWERPAERENTATDR